MTQTKLGSFIEALCNVLIGYFIALLSQIIIFPLFDINISITTNIYIGLWFTLISIVRSYIIRRWFNRSLHNACMSLSKSITK